MTRTIRCSWIVLAAAAFAAAACDRPSNDVSAASSPPPMKTPVGPVPGPDEQPTRPNNPYTGDRSATGEGRQLFVRFNCSGCHGGRAGGGMGPSLRDVDWIYGSTDAQVFSSIAEGRGHGMPAWGVKLNEDQIWKLVAYIKTLRTQNEVQPPS
jgi:cytochrome c oxidase cbb3-type subunit 3